MDRGPSGWRARAATAEARDEGDGGGEASVPGTSEGPGGGPPGKRRRRRKRKGRRRDSEREMEERSLLGALGWGEVVGGVARFCSTEGGAELCRSLRPAGDRVLAERLLAETALAGAAEVTSGTPLEFGAWGLVGEAVEAARGRGGGGRSLTGQQLRGVADVLSLRDTLEARLGAVEEAGEGAGRFVLLPGEAAEAMARLFAVQDDDDGSAVELAREVARSLAADGSVLDAADEAVARARREREAAEAALDVYIREAARGAAQAGATRGLDADECLAVVRGRRCVVLAAGRSDTVGGGVTLGKSKTALTLYVEPRAAVALNNASLGAAADERAACQRVLARLTARVAEEAVGRAVQAAAALVARLDCAAARARFAAWAGGVRPEFGETRAFGVRGLCHPGLLCKEGAEDLDAGDPAGLRRCAARDASGAEGGSLAPARPFRVVPIDIVIGEGVRCVTITGANAGGKTMALKNVGLASAMARAGIFLCLGEGSGGEGGRPVLPFCDRILADIGDPQSLADNLSTFSGHLVQLAAIIEASTPDTLVLLDEVGDGTDPVDGAAFAEAVLRHLALEVGCTVLASSHYPGLKRLPGEAFEDASVEFDPDTLAPTHRLLWGVPGESHALDLAARLGLPGAVLSAAHDWMRTEAGEGGGGAFGTGGGALARQMREALDEESARSKAAREELEVLASQLEAARADLLRAAGFGETSEQEGDEVPLQKLIHRAKMEGAAEVDELCQETLARIRSGGTEVKEALDAALMESAADSAAAVLAAAGGIKGAKAGAAKAKANAEADRGPDKQVWTPRKGERICVPAMGNLVVIVKAVKKGGVLEVEGTQGLMQGQSLRLTREEVAPFQR